MSLSALSTPTRVIFGDGVRSQLADLVATHDAPRVLLVATTSSLQRPAMAALKAALEQVAPVAVWEKIRPNPRTSDVDDCYAAFKGAGITHVVGIGGGSALDQAKAVAMALSYGGNVAAMLAAKALPDRTNTLILVPTTSGTGSELSYGSILTDEATGQKLGLRGMQQAADIALVDPELTWSLPTGESVVGGFDALAHAIETWVSTAATPYTQDLSRGALTRIFRWLPVVHEDPTNARARREMSYAAMAMGVNLALSTTCLPHRLQYPVGAATDTAHGAGLAALYPAWLNHVRPYAEDKLAACSDWLQLEPPTASSAERADAFVRAMGEFMHHVDLHPHLSELGVTPQMVDTFPAEVSGKLETDPGYRGTDDITAIYQDAYARAVERG